MIRSCAYLCCAAMLWPAVAHADQVLSSCDNASEWQGGSIVESPRQEGTGAVRWEIGTSDILRRDGLNQDLTAYNALRFWMHSSNANGSRIAVYLGSENSASSGTDYYVRQLTIDWTGWREVLIFVREFSAAREPLGWQQIDNLRFYASGWNNTPDPTLILHVDDVRAVAVETEHTPTNEELLEALDLSLPELASVAEDYDAGDLAGALTSLAEYFRTRTQPDWFFDPHQIDTSVSFNQARADNEVNGTYSIVGCTYTFPGAVIDWGFNPTANNPEVAYTAEWVWHFNQLEHWSDFGRGFWRTGDVRYAEAFASQVESFVTTRPAPLLPANVEGSSWRTLDSGYRLAGAWTESWFRFLHAAAFTDERLVLMLRGFLAHGLYLRHYQTSGNWIIYEMAGLYTVGAAFPEFLAAQDWRRFSANTLLAQMDLQLLPDGAQFELAPGYHAGCLDSLALVGRTAAVTGTEADLPAVFSGRLADMMLWLVKIMQPDGQAPNFNDNWGVNVPARMASLAPIGSEIPAVAWAASRQGTPPAWTSLMLPDSGFAIMRTGWALDSHYLLFDVGPLSAGHSHQDKLNLIMASYGRTILFDPGPGMYEESAYRAWGIDSFAHNTMLVDGLAQLRKRNGATDPLGAGDPSTPTPAFSTQPVLDYAAAVYQDPYGPELLYPARHRREVLFFKDRVAAIVVDTLSPNDENSHQYQARWQLLTTATERDETTGTVRSADDGKPNLAVVPLGAVTVRVDSGVTSPEVLGWDLHMPYSPAATLRHDLQGAGVQRFVTLLVPLAAGEEEVPLALTALAPGQYGATWPDGEIWTIGVATDGSPGVRVQRAAPGAAPEEVFVSPDALPCSDFDGDGVGQPASSDCPRPGIDCNDRDPSVGPGGAELCNGTDDDCDGAVDEGCACLNGESRACYSGPEGTAGVGLCATGEQSCVDGLWGDCSGEVLPTTEICADEQDNDCDGNIDETEGCTGPDSPPCSQGEACEERRSNEPDLGLRGQCGCQAPGRVSGGLLWLLLGSGFWLRRRSRWGVGEL